MPGNYQYAITLLDGTDIIDSFVIDGLWEQSACEWVRLLALQRTASPMCFAEEVNLLPKWHATLGEPYMEGFSACISALENCEWTFSSSYFAETAQNLATALLAQGRMNAGQKFLFIVSAFAKKEQQTKDTMSIKEIPAIPVAEGFINDFVDASAAAGISGPVHEDELMSVFVDEEVLKQAAERSTCAIETGGLLIGKLFRDPDARLFIVVTAQLPAEHTKGEIASLIFTTDTWNAARTAISLRKNGEFVVGWWHSHPAKQWCMDCDPEKKRTCALQGGCFFSSEDRNLHRTIFPRAYSIALVMTDGYAGMKTDLYGWHAGDIRQRSYYVTKKPAVSDATETKGIQINACKQQ